MVRVAIVGLGNCASALVQGVHYYSVDNSRSERGLTEGLISERIGHYTVNDIDFVLGFDVDVRKIGKPIQEAIFELPNCCMSLSPGVRYDPSGRFSGPVLRGPIMDGVSKHMETHDPLDTERFCLTEIQRSEDEKKYQLFEDYAALLRSHKVQVLVNYLPVGSQAATEFWANVCLLAGCNMVNCIPVFIASSPEWNQRFADKKLSLIGDDMKSQFGASILSQMFQELAESRGHHVKVHIQQNSGGNTDFYNMTNADRLASKKVSKENVIKDHGSRPDFFHAGPSDYIRVYQDTKVAHFHLELRGFGDAPVVLDARLQVQDSPNSAGIVIDAIRYVMVANERGLYGSLEGPSAFTQKSPPKALRYAEALEACNTFKT